MRKSPMSAMGHKATSTTALFMSAFGTSTARDRERLMRAPHLSAHDIARAEGVSAAYIYATLRLAWLAPDIVEAIVNGRQPKRLTATELFRLSGHLPLGWPQQRTLIGFTNDDTARA